MVELFDAKYTAGFSVPGYYSRDTDFFMPYPDYGSEIKRHILLMEFLAVPSQGTELEFPIYDHDIKQLNDLQLNLQPGRYVCVHPGSRGSWRQWPVEHFAALADFCKEQGYEVVLTGTKDESAIIDNVIDHMNYTPINTAGKTSIGSVGALIKDAALLISNCTGVSHMAAAFQTPSIVISMDGEPQRWGPINHELHRTINWLQSPDFHFVFRETVEMINLLESGVLLPHAV
jgi:ADP-heptose:LPS heptosyltransferase